MSDFKLGLGEDGKVETTVSWPSAAPLREAAPATTELPELTKRHLTYYSGMAIFPHNEALTLSSEIHSVVSALSSRTHRLVAEKDLQALATFQDEPSVAPLEEAGEPKGESLIDLIEEASDVIAANRAMGVGEQSIDFRLRQFRSRLFDALLSDIPTPPISEEVLTRLERVRKSTRRIMQLEEEVARLSPRMQRAETENSERPDSNRLHGRRMKTIEGMVSDAMSAIEEGIERFIIDHTTPQEREILKSGGKLSEDKMLELQLGADWIRKNFIIEII